MNFAMNLAYNVEERLSEIERPEGWTDADEDQAYEEVLEQVVKEDGRAWAAGDIRMGDIILIVDSDTRVPEDCLLDAATEFFECPDIAILQHKSGVMQVVHNYWENGITYFTRLIYASITYAVAAGDTGPFVGYYPVIDSLILDIMHLSDGLLCKKCYGRKTDKRNGGLNPMYLKISKCRLNCKTLGGEYDTQHIVATDSKKVYHLQSTTSWLVGRNTATDVPSSCFIQ